MTDAGFRPHERLRDPAAFRRAFDRRKPASDESLVVHATENGLGHPRIGIVVSRKRMRRATDRNRFKRIIREAYRLTKREWPAGFDFVILPRKPAIGLAEAREALPALARAVARRLTKPRTGPAERPQAP